MKVEEEGREMGSHEIRIATCCSDGRCPECGYVGEGGYRFTSGSPCGCTVCVICEPVHLRALLTEAIRQRDDTSQRCPYRMSHPTIPGAITSCCVLDFGHDEPHKVIEVAEEERDAALCRLSDEYMRGVKAVLSIRCMKHRDVKQMNAREIGGGECAACAIDAVTKERDAATRKGASERAMLDEILALPDIEAPTRDGSENVTAVVANALEALREERDEAVARADRLYQDRHDLLNVTTKDGLLASEWVMRTAKAERERDEARSAAQQYMEKTDKHLDGLCQKIEVAEERADRAEALLRSIASDPLWLVWSAEHEVWWRSNSCGYTRLESEAGRYSLTEALQCCAKRSAREDGKPNEVAVPSPELLAKIREHFGASAK